MGEILLTEPEGGVRVQGHRRRGGPGHTRVATGGPPFGWHAVGGGLRSQANNETLKVVNRFPSPVDDSGVGRGWRVDLVALGGGVFAQAYVICVPDRPGVRRHRLRGRNRPSGQRLPARAARPRAGVGRPGVRRGWNRR